MLSTFAMPPHRDRTQTYHLNMSSQISLYAAKLIIVFPSIQIWTFAVRPNVAVIAFVKNRAKIQHFIEGAIFF